MDLSSSDSEKSGSVYKAILYAFFANLGIALSKTWAAMHTGSGSMLAEAIHSYADCGNQLLLVLGMKQAGRPADSDHPMGYGKLTYFWSFIVALMLFSMGGLFSIYEGVHKLESHEPLNQAWIGLVVLIVAIGLEGLSLLGCLKQIKLLRGDKSLFSWIRATRQSELLVVLSEDVAAITGLVLAAGFLGAAIVTGDNRYDAMGSISVGAVLIVISLFLAFRIRALMVGQSAAPEIRSKIDRIITEHGAVDHLFNSITLQFGPNIMLAVKIRMKPELTLNEAILQINALEKQLKEQVPQIGWCFVEPDIED
ncbi:MAG: cation diffusion facilitator family transporter [Pseudomonadales bacterium]|nr:cation diffusion facilitator family transporter [Pseudomonadales bacterium]